MNLSWLDWAILFGCTGLLGIFSLYTVRHVRSVADFLSANRSAGRYLLTIAGQMSSCGAISAIALFEMYYVAGFVPCWWGMMSIPVGVIIILSGWVYYRFRETRAMTMAQFYEMRYSKSFRIYSGIITWASGVVNFGIFPIVEARFFVYFCGLPVTMSVLGWEMPTVAPVMALTLGISLLFTVMGGQITGMATDCVQGIFSAFGYIVIAVFLLAVFNWGDIVEALKMAPAQASMINPYNTANVPDFNVWFYLIGIFGAFYGYMSWQGSAGFQSSGLNPHEQKMGGIIACWRTLVQSLMFLLVPISVFVFLNLPKYTGAAAAAHQAVQAISDPALQNQMRVPIAFSYILPAGLKGLFATIMLFLLISTQDTYIHSWGSMFIQDVILPFRKKPFTPKQQINLLRLSIIGVGVFSFVFGLLFKQTEYIVMYFAITGAIVSGGGAVIVGGLYWKRATAAGAWVAMTIGWVMALGRILLQQIGPHFKDVADPGMLVRAMNYVNAVNSQVIWFWIMVSCIASYVLVSLFTRDEGFVLERMLHRGKYAIAGEHQHAEGAKSLWQKLLGITEEFTRTDRWLAYALLIWNFGWFAVFLLGTVYNVTVGMSDDAWAKFWRIWIWMQIGIGVPATIWFTIGGISDLRKLFERLATLERDDRDDGRVVHHHLATEEDEPGQPDAPQATHAPPRVEETGDSGT